MSESKQHNNFLWAMISLVSVIVLVGTIGYFSLKSPEDIIQGQVDCDSYRVSCKLPGRVVDIRVKEGDYVHVGDTLAIIQIPEVTAQEQVMQATGEAAAAVSDMAHRGTRSEVVQTAEDVLKQAQAAASIAQKTFKRMDNLYKEGVISAQKRDEAQAAYDATQAQVSAAEAQLRMAKKGLRKEERTAAGKQAQAAKHAVDVVKGLLKETVQIATVEGEVSDVYVLEGELVGLGSPIMSISLLHELWGTFNVREDQLTDMKIGKQVNAFVPAFHKIVPMQVFYVKDQGSYAAWRATKSTGQYDLKTFEVKMRPVKPLDGLRPGMSLILKND